jgi:hypothetical protein
VKAVKTNDEIKVHKKNDCSISWVTDESDSVGDCSLGRFSVFKRDVSEIFAGTNAVGLFVFLEQRVFARRSTEFRRGNANGDYQQHDSLFCFKLYLSEQFVEGQY